MKTLNDYLRYRSAKNANKMAYRFLENGEEENKSINFKTLNAKAEIIALNLLQSAKKGDRALLLYPSGIDYIEAFFGCLLAGIVAVPVYPPSGRRKIGRLERIALDCDAKLILSTDIVFKKNQKWLDENKNVKKLIRLNTRELKKCQAVLPNISETDIAFLQYTSGSTSAPKGVMITHKNLVSHLIVLKKVMQVNEKTVCVGWLPVYHDMGLIGNILLLFFAGGTYIFMSPVSFVQKPIRWLKAISEYKAILSGGPNFSYDLCIEKIGNQEIAHLDLSSWIKAYNGAEPIKKATLDNFHQKFKTTGFKRESFKMAYGLAEATLAVSWTLGNIKNEKALTVNEKDFHKGKIKEINDDIGSEDSKDLVPCGEILENIKVKIVDPSTKLECSENKIGEIWLSGPTIALGYWNKSDINKSVFNAKVRNQSDQAFMRTGDMGFVKNEQLYITGRLKEMIIINGQNYFPQDLELVVQETDDSFSQNCGVAFSIQIHGEEKLFIAQEIKRDKLKDYNPEKLSAKIRSSLALQFDLTTYGIILLSPTKVSKTTSGKIQRNLIRQNYLNKSLEGIIYEWRRDNPIGIGDNSEYKIVDQLKQLLSKTLKIPINDINDKVSFFELGMSSLQGMSFSGSINEHFNLLLSPMLLYQYDNLKDLAEKIVALKTDINLPYYEAMVPHSSNKVSKIDIHQKNEYMLSSMQKRLLFIHKLSNIKTLYNIYYELDFRGELSISILEITLFALIQRHESLRTIINAGQKGYIASILPPQLPNLNVHDISDEHYQDQSLFNIREKAMNHIFDFTIPPIVFNLIKLEDRRFKFTITQHHLFTDGWSLMMLLKEIIEIYDVFEENKPLPLTPLNYHYSNFVEREQKAIESQTYYESKKYWESKLEGLEKLVLPADFPYQIKRSNNGDFVRMKFSLDETLGIVDFVKSQGVSLNTFLISAFSILLWRYCKKPDFVIGCVNVNRTSKEFNVQGFFLNTIILRFKLLEELNLSDYLKTVEKNIKESLKHSYVSLEEIIDSALQEEYIERRENQFYNVSYAYEDFDFFVPKNVSKSKWEVTSPKLDGSVLGTAKDDLSLLIAMKDGALMGDLNFSTDIFKKGTIIHMVQNLKDIILWAIQNERQKIYSLKNKISDKERSKLLNFNKLTIKYPINLSIIDLFENQVKKYPSNIAIAHNEQQISYKDLDKQSNNLAKYLIDQKIVPGTLVGICLNPSIEMIVSILAILKSGGAYVPIDPAYPKERIQYILEDANIDYLISKSSIILGRDVKHQIFIDKLRLDFKLYLDGIVFPPIHPNNPAYVIYTSGSTGNPKGVLVSHTNVVRLFKSEVSLFDFRSTDTWVFYHSFCFDFSIWEIFGALFFGGKLIVIDPGVKKDIHSFSMLLANQKVTILNLTPTAYSALESTLISLNQDVDVRYLIFGGEALNPRKVKNWKYSYPNCKIINMYGITEATVHTTFKELTEKEIKSDKSIIGTPIPTMACYVLDEQQHLSPLGISGELYIAGAGVSQGYLSREALTQERFLPNPFDKNANVIYRTGDLAKWNLNGELEYLGRNDDQIKIDGYRIEPGEIQERLKSHTAVQDAIVLADNNTNGSSISVFFIPEPDECYSICRQFYHKNNNMVPEGSSLFSLSNGLSVYGWNKAEIKFLDKEIFEEDSYLNFGVKIPNTGVVFDIGSNIGLFSIYSHLVSKDVEIYSFEPIPTTFELLKLNLDLFQIEGIKLFNHGLSDKEEKVNFNHFPKATVLSSKNLATTDIKKNLGQFLNNSERINIEDHLEELLENQLTVEEYRCQLRTLSSIIEENEVQVIHLLKIDVEGMELDVLNGISDRDWKRIKQVIIEVHNIDRRIDVVLKILEKNDFNVFVEQKSNLKGTNLYNVYAIAKNYEVMGNNIPTVKGYYNIEYLKEDLKLFLQGKLPHYMVPSNYYGLLEFPSTLNGKLDKERLLSLKNTQLLKEYDYVPPRNKMEVRVIEIWKEIFGIQKISVTDNFFELGGNSIKIMLLANEYNKIFHVQLSLAELFACITPKSQVSLIKSKQRVDYKFISKAPIHPKGFYELSSAQLRLWLHSKVNKDHTSYNMYGKMSLGKDFNKSIFKRTLELLIARHETLRTVFIEDNGKPKQLVLDPENLSYEFEVIDYDLQIEKEIATKVFDLSQWPLFKILVVKEKEKYNLSCCMHHIISDGWSIDIFVKELKTLYESNNLNINLPFLPIQYKDYAYWQNSYFESEICSKQRQYWLSKLKKPMARIELPRDRFHRGKIENAYYLSFIDLPLLEKIKKVSLDKKVTIFSILVACFKVLLYKITGENDLTLGCPATNREKQEVKNLMGLFINVLMIRNFLSGKNSFNHFLNQVNRSIAEGIENQSYPFEKLLEDLDLERDNNSFPISSIFLNMVDFDVLNLERIEDFSVRRGNIFSEVKFDFECYFKSYENGLSIKCVYNKNLYNDETILYWIKNFQSIITQVVDNTSISIDKIKVFQEKLEKSSNKNTLPNNKFFGKFEDSNGSIVQLIERQSNKHPERNAVISKNRKVTYRMLNYRANGIAHEITKAIKSTQNRIALFLEHGYNAISGILGVLKSNNIYIPLNSDYPVERIRTILVELGCNFIIVDSKSEEKIKAITCNIDIATLINIDLIEPNITNPNTSIKPDDIAYILFTSGSTGRPKGVMQSHKNLLYHTNAYSNRLKISHADNLIMISQYTYDSTVQDIFGALTNGATIISYDLMNNGFQKLKSFFKDYCVSILHIVPTTFRCLMDIIYDTETLKNVRILVLGGEPVYNSDYQKFKKHFNAEAIFINSYGTTESSTAMQNIITNEFNDLPENVPVGFSVEGTRVFIINEKGEEAKIYEEGEVIFESDYLAIQYLNDLKLSNQLFISNPVTNNGRVYRTGDIGRKLPNGSIQLMRRKDKQIKINGVRVELLEIEYYLREMNEVNEAVVLIEKLNAEYTLVAYLCFKSTPLEKENIIKRLKESLPLDHIPKIYVFLDKFPLTNTGKIDLPALQAIEKDAFTLKAYVAPRTEFESKLVDLWKDVLPNLSRKISCKDDFFELGGNSLKALQMTLKINEIFQVNLSIDSVFKKTVLENLAREIEALSWIITSEKHRGTNRKEMEI